MEQQEKTNNEKSNQGLAHPATNVAGSTISSLHRSRNLRRSGTAAPTSNKPLPRLLLGRPVLEGIREMCGEMGAGLEN
jgi:hypothetical protein